MRIVRLASAPAVLIALSAATASARDIFVNNVEGDDVRAGRQPVIMSDGSGPVRTIGRALELAATGDRIVLADAGQPYRESISLVGSRHSGYSFRPLVIEGSGAILDGSAPVPANAWEPYRGPVFRFRPPGLACQQLFLNDRPAPRVLAGPGAEGPPKLDPLQWCLYGGYIYFSIEPDTTRLPQDYALAYASKRAGITLFHVSRVVIANLTVQGFQLDGISAYNSAREVTLAGVTCRGNGRSGITVGGASQVRINTCLLGDNGTAQLLTLPYSETSIEQTTLIGNTAPGWVDQGGRVYVAGRRVEGGLEELFAETPQKSP